MPKLKQSDIAPTSEEDASIREGIALDPDTHELTIADFARMKPVSEVTPHVLERASPRRSKRGKQRASVKERITIRIDADIAAHFRATGPGWQTRLNDALRHAIAREPRGRPE